MPGEPQINSPLELDTEARRLEHTLSRLRSPRLRFHTIIDFYRSVKHLPPSWLGSYFAVFNQFLAEGVTHRGLDTCIPSRWSDCLELLSAYSVQEEDEEFTGDPYLLAAWKNAFLSYSYAGDFRNLEALLFKHDGIAQELSEASWKRIFSAADNRLQALDQFISRSDIRKDYMRSAARQAIAQWREFATDKCAVPVVLLESTLPSDEPVGSVQHLEIGTERDRHAHIHFRNELDIAGSNTIIQLTQAESHAVSLVERFLKKRPPETAVHFRFHEYAATYSGESLGLGAALALAARYTQLMNGRERWYYSPDTAAVGRLRETGDIEPADEDLMRKKIEIAFFSPIECILISGGDLEYASKIIGELTGAYPNRVLRIAAVNHIHDAVLLERGLEIERRSKSKRLAQGMKNHPILLFSALLLLLALGIVYFANKAYYEYPDLETSLGINVATNAIVYNPHADPVWCFRDAQDVKDGTIPFGDLEVGDSFTRNFWFWNMTPLGKDVILAIEGPDSSDWYINWRPGLQTAPAAGSLRFSVMFNPLSEGESKTAWLHVLDPRTQRSYFSLKLSGSAGSPEPGGYALRFDGKDDMLHFGRKSSAFDVDEATIECWLKPYEVRQNNVFHDGSNAEHRQAYYDMLISLTSTDSLYIKIGNTSARIRLPERLHIAPHRWTHLAVAYSYSERKRAVYVNGESVFEGLGGFLKEGSGDSYVTVGAWNDMRESSDFYYGEIDELRVWRKMRTGDEIRNTMYKAIPHDSPGLNGYWNMDTPVEEVAFSASAFAHNGELLHRPEYVRSSVPLEPPATHPTLVPGPNEDSALCLPPATYLVCGRNVLPEKSDATFYFRFHTLDTSDVELFAFANLDYHVRVSTRKVSIGGYDARSIHYTPLYGWNSVAIMRKLSGRHDIRVNGHYTATVHTNGLESNMHRFEGIQLGFFNDKYNNLGPKYGTLAYERSRSRKTFASVAIWSRVPTSDERWMSNWLILPNGDYAAFWELNCLPDSNGNIYDKSGKYPLHFNRLRYWE